MISREICQRVLQRAVSTGADYAEIFAENTTNHAISMIASKVDSIKDTVISGAAVRVYKGLRSVMASTVDMSEAGLIRCAESAAEVLQTLRSRCVEIKLHKTESRQTELPDETEGLCRAIASQKIEKIAAVTVRLETRRISREELAAALEGAREVFTAALKLHYGAGKTENNQNLASYIAKNLTKVQIMRTIELLQKYHGECGYNVGTGHVLGALAAELEGIL